MPYANNKDTDQPAHLGGLISIFLAHSKCNIISIDAILTILRLKLASETEWNGLSYKVAQLRTQVFW